MAVAAALSGRFSTDVCVGIFILFKNILENNNNIKEDFTPKIRNMYRPYIRNVRIISEGFYNHNNNKINNLFIRF